MKAHRWIPMGLLFSVAAMVASVVEAQVISVSDFEDNSTDGWSIAPFAPPQVAPTLIANGGPHGGDDAFLELTSLGGNGPGSRLAAFNQTPDWVGSYTELGATAIEVDMMNSSGNPLSMRVVIFGDGSTSQRWTSSTPFSLPNDGQWHHARFSLAEDDLSSVVGDASYAAMMGDIVRVMLRHDDRTPSPGGSSIAAKVGLDNIRLVKPIDFNGDGMLDIADVDLLLQEIKSGMNSLVFDLNGDNVVDPLDIDILVTGPENLNTYIGDADLNGEFGTTDLVAVFAAGQYEDDVMMNSTWETGDWNGDAEFGTGDLVAAFEDGGFELGPRPAIPSVPEPTTGFLFGAFLLSLALRRRLNSTLCV